MTEDLPAILENFALDARWDLEARWAAWELDLSRNEIHEVVGGLMARQVSLSTEVVRNPETWNPHIGPLALRAMIDVHISLAWILMNPEERARQFIEYGLGQVKLQIEHFKEAAANTQADPDMQPMVAMLEGWLNEQRLIFLTEVNIGSWSGASTRTMAEEAGCLDLYRFAYTVFSEAAHSTWHHISMNNLKRCSSPLHRHHSIPYAPQLHPNLYYLHMAAEYLEMTLSLVDEKLELQVDGQSAFSKLMDRLDTLKDHLEADNLHGAGEEDSIDSNPK